MSEQKPPPGLRGERDEHLILDEVTDQLATTFRLLSGDPNEAAERAFADIGVNTRAEAALLGEIAAPGPLEHPDRFEQSHRLAMRALEVADRGAWKHPQLPRLGPLSGAAESGGRAGRTHDRSGPRGRRGAGAFEGSTLAARRSRSRHRRSGGCWCALVSRPTGWRSGTRAAGFRFRRC